MALIMAVTAYPRMHVLKQLQNQAESRCSGPPPPDAARHSVEATQAAYAIGASLAIDPS